MDNKYTRKYDRVVRWFKQHQLSKEVHCEKHHILPRSLGGSDNDDNIVSLPVRWHYIVHCWLPAVCLERGDQESYEKMLFAWNRMQNYRKGHREALGTIKEDSLLYEKTREQYLKIIGTHTSKVGKQNSMFGKHWWKDPNDRTKCLCIKEGDPVPDGWIKGRWCSTEFLEKMKQNSFSRGRICITNRETRERKYIMKEERSLYGPEWFDGYSEDGQKGRFYTFDGKDRIFVQTGRQPPVGSFTLSEWRKNHHLSTSKKLSSEELSKRKNERAKRFMDHVKQQLPLWIEMYQWYLENDENFEAVCKKYGYTKGRDAFLARARKYFPELYKWNPHGGKRNSRPKQRGPYKKHK